MLVKKFELWIDESGDFKKETNLKKNPSLVGGVLVEKDSFSQALIKQILNNDFVHSNEMDSDTFGEYAVELLSKIRNKNGELVIFENEERLEIIDSNTTYLNILSEGIIQLLQLLAAQHGNIELELLIAVRLDMEIQDSSPGQIINHEEYIKRLEEKIIIGLARRALSNSKHWSWSIKLASARKDQRLMLADVVCNSYLTKSSKKFNDIQREELKALYNETYLFTVFEKSTKAYIKKLLGEGEIGEAIFEVYTIEEKINKKELVQIIINKLRMLDDEGIRIQLLNIKIRVGALIKIDNDLTKSKKVLINIQEQFIPLLEENDINPGVFSLDIYLYLLTVYTHEGNLEMSQKQINLSENTLKNLGNRWESIDYYFMFKIRQAVHEINSFDFNKAVDNMTDVITALDETLGLFTLAKGIEDICTEIRSDIMGKALGTRLQARNYLIREDIKQLSKAQNDSDRAIMEFMHDSDITRQYQYRSNTECEGGNYLEALNYLCNSMGVVYDNEESLVVLLNLIMEKQLSISLYGLMHYTRIMSKAKIDKDDNIADIMFIAWNKVKISSSSIITEPINSHPFEIILWKLGSYMASSGNIPASIRYYNDAIKLCNSIPDRLTLRATGLGIMAEKASILGNNENKYLKEFNLSTKEFINNYNQFMESNLPDSMMDYFKHWEDLIEDIEKTNDVDVKSTILWNISRNIVY